MQPTEPRASAPLLDHTYSETFPGLTRPAQPDIPQGTRLTWLNENLARDLGLNPAWLRTDAGLAWMTGRGEAPTVALAYSGYQFGQLSPVLGDGRAHLVGELAIPAREEGGSAARCDLHIKGSGRTPFSRPGSDGKAPLSAAWREAVIGESLHALGLPTTRALAVFETGEKVQRRAPEPEPAGLVLRVAASHLRVGTFQFAQYHCDPEVRGQLVDYALARHYPDLTPGETRSERALALLRAVAQRQAHLVASWQALGFVHGVLNTDNVTISGEAIDFGPCAFIDAFERGKVFSSIDRQGRYAYNHQPGITAWNLSRFAETLLDIIDPEDPNRAIHLATEVISEFEDEVVEQQIAAFAIKLGLDLGGVGEDVRAQVGRFGQATLGLLERHALDFTGFFRSLAEGTCMLPEEDRQGWLARWEELKVATGTTPERATELMLAHNPVYIPRNLALDAALRQMERGNRQPIEELLEAVSNPFERHAGLDYLEGAPAESRFFTSFCGT
ncbi:protein adenylyltransferase SelO family protein [Rothia nasimurium]|uniref:protein adenylyltransferase SelO family protein n=1 Tax=Rothia nasimurium TaxID=85336 RepID=UPI001F231509|nr:protein adenylyltransferase SelO family protein [Rothia nasimurium]